MSEKHTNQGTALAQAREALEKSEDLLAFYVGSQDREYVDAELAVRINYEDFGEILSGVRAALAALKGGDV